MSYRRRSLQFVFLLITISQQFLFGFSDDPKDTKKGSSNSKKGLKILIICIGLAVVVTLLSFLFKLWQKKKREEQHARLLKLFEEDDELELELELGLSD